MPFSYALIASDVNIHYVFFKSAACDLLSQLSSYSFTLILVLFIRLVIERLFFEILISDDVIFMVFIISTMPNSRLVVKNSAGGTLDDNSNVSNDDFELMMVKKLNKINSLY